MTTVGPAATWVPVPEGSDFPVQNLPYGVFDDGDGTRCGVAIGDSVLDLAGCERHGIFEGTGLEAGTFEEPALNAFLRQDRSTWSTVRRIVAHILDARNDEGRHIVEENGLLVTHPVELGVPIHIGDYVDFYSSEQHATNVGRMFRPGSPPLPENWKHLPIGYHGRAGTVVASGTPVHRPLGQRRGEVGPAFGPTQRLDIEVEVGFVTGRGPDPARSITVDEAETVIFGVCLVNDWSARDIQAWEYVPLGPFLGKSFATTMSPWIVPLEALEPFRLPAPPQTPEPLAYLLDPDRRGIAIDLRVDLTTASGAHDTIIETAFDGMYWTMAQQLAHATVNGATTRAGDLYASGTVSGESERSFGSLLERTWNGTRPLTLSNGESRSFLEDGDRVTITGRCSAPGAMSIGFGDCTGTIVG